MSARAIGELERTRANLLQVGTIAEADYATARVRVLMAGLTSAWLPWLTGRAGGDRSWAAPEVGEQVLVACPDGDPANGVVVGAIYQADYAAPAASPDVQRTTYSDGAVIEYDRAAHALRATLPAGSTAAVVADGGVSITGDTTITGTLTVSELVNAQQGITTSGGAGATVTITGNLHVTEDITSDGDQIAEGISQVHHVHDGVQPGGGNTGEPV
jgi:phage baseplate assembly protein V